ncbi:[acyl-carrier-protein] S-malonyltransferase [Shewanella sp. Choline-02u-19]|uniref:ACP S-malonyltransferase n=1 Tax=unclassified Shewanella TaxID=196818 RepID=UPI000C347EEC|nr:MULTISPECIES: ACP S-malonyltransferase [unclassified Shewanella]PKG57680.1 [acyl-carrier-protein] S-malonyltransferase [Shewanella sp. GutDb-MelDb]PKG72515.1 [acyl-carrier-protein] S-malonyltransferase [Shewanella sp. GutCb]PKH56527.1 [acyl-carrier-protein] S-malonyltransferase [Shewanella sp. Bg11-22]PKI27967.1 [acyl-carrier-protein] S-malonyltransferase [Shewanella sp. Choline-02u-19]
MENTAFVFPGQGSQALGMLAELAESQPIIGETFAQASNVLGYDLWELVQQGPVEALNQTDKTQPALLAASVAIYRAYAASGKSLPKVMAGHSLGEYSALVCAGVMGFEAAIKLVELRGQLMQQAVPAGTGAMFAIIGLDNDAIATACAEAAQGEVVSPVNYNSPGQVVIAGEKAAVERAAAICKENGAKMAVALPVSVPSHCQLMKPAADKLAIALIDIEFSIPSVKVINNVDVASPNAAQEIKAALVRQLYCPVRWSETVELMAEQGITDLFEIGPGKVLTGLSKRINRSLTAKAINDVASFAALTE